MGEKEAAVRSGPFVATPSSRADGERFRPPRRAEWRRWSCGNGKLKGARWRPMAGVTQIMQLQTNVTEGQPSPQQAQPHSLFPPGRLMAGRFQ